MTRALLKGRPHGARPILAADFAREMLSRGARRFKSRDSASSAHAPFAVAIEADALHLPLRAASLDLIVAAFGFRNLANYESGLREFARVLKPGAQLGILDFAEPGGLMGRAYAVYFRRILPVIGRLISGRVGAGQAGPYSYLPASVARFPSPPEMLTLMRATGYSECKWQPYTFGIAGLYTGVRRAAG
jgi:demethylmenaquinone methyltransferase/2-methoxy-6-polyprenyl-1,4-benzoquinol methylase